MPRMTAVRRAERRAEILEAAESCFARLGFHRTTMRDVIAEASLSAGCVYKHFKSKHEIVAAIAADRHASEMNLMAGSIPMRSPAHRSLSFTGSYCRSSGIPRSLSSHTCT